MNTKYSLALVHIDSFGGAPTMSHWISWSPSVATTTMGSWGGYLYPFLSHIWAWKEGEALELIEKFLIEMIKDVSSPWRVASVYRFSLASLGQVKSLACYSWWLPSPRWFDGRDLGESQEVVLCLESVEPELENGYPLQSTWSVRGSRGSWVIPLCGCSNEN